MNSTSVKMISIGLRIGKFRALQMEAESEGARMLLETKIDSLEREYFEIWFDDNRVGLEDKFIVEYSESGKDIEDIKIMLNGPIFIEWAMEICFTSLNQN